MLIVHGDRDDFTGINNYDAWTDDLRTITEGESKGKLEVVQVDSGNHYWGDEGPRSVLIAALQSFV